ncbi:hypothetical protein K6U06_11080 [Acidiferrimicrobium sp. IK]|uniref:hypothetical protein n=1 Tax=Acidiferrimicrobium sp. IK TaxID=2871700 RepID=UPI0021CB1F77|nr:hypothetical protein [Acidiferrimicrobium sp. IK]MCU4184904.1 hypothetical protein [Acidiferrimicrobium sp. IK]
MKGPLAYAFWHQPAEDASIGEYEAALVAFHRALAADPPAGWRESWSWRLPVPPWWPGVPTPGAPAYLDWYVVRDLEAVGHLADAAVDARRLAAHDAAARQAGAGAGAGGLYRLVVGAPDRPPGAAGTVGFADKARGVPWQDAVQRFGDRHDAVWMRQLTLGPGPEFAVIGPTGSGWPVDGWAVTAPILPPAGGPPEHISLDELR